RQAHDRLRNLWFQPIQKRIILMKITVARTAGFCMGVKRAIEMALEAAQKNHLPIYTYGPLIHNTHVLEMLQNKGIYKTSDPTGLSSGILLIRTHGISPQEKLTLEQTGLTMIDATCPRVQRIHSQINKYVRKGYKIIVFGDPDHAEVVGLLGTAGENGNLITNPEDIDELPPITGPILFVSQTTQSRHAYQEVITVLTERYPDLIVIDTLCSTTEERQDEVLELAQNHDVIVVVGGKNSANTTRLAKLCSEQGRCVYHVETEEELPPSFPAHQQRIAVTAGASTPNWMIERVVDRLEAIQRPDSIQTRLMEIIKSLTESNILVALGSASLALTCSFYITHTVYLIPVIIVAAYVYCMHILNHFADRAAVAINEPLREEVFRSHQNVFILFGILSGTVALALSAYLGIWTFLMVAFATATGAMYSFHIVPHFLVPLIRYRRLKDIPASKDIVVALAWSSVTVLVPSISQLWQKTALSNLVIVWLFVFVFVYIRTVMLDIKDIQGDRIVGKETIPILLGEKKALKLVRLLLLVEAAVIITGSLLNLLPLRALIQLLALGPILVVITRYKAGQLRRRYHYQALLDLSLLSSGIITLLFLLF
ncbi:4-hydroxy-3-methylbut-2-enyl diphosphate reductase, partial [candidate division CSSED10-310 bacterium]